MPEFMHCRRCKRDYRVHPVIAENQDEEHQNAENADAQLDFQYIVPA